MYHVQISAIEIFLLIIIYLFIDIWSFQMDEESRNTKVFHSIVVNLAILPVIILLRLAFEWL